ncbi:hypothetical protein GCM10017711_19630 [Paeniglutamicibacter sulfureus]
MDLDDQAHGLVLVGHVLAARQRRVVGNARVQVRRNGNDDLLGVDAHIRAVGGHARIGPVQLEHRVVQEDVFAQPFGKGDRDALHGADDAAVEDEVFVDEVGEGSGGGGHQQRLQRGEGVGGFGEHAAGDEQPDVVAGDLVAGNVAQPMVEGDLVELLGLRVFPRGVRVDLGGEAVHFGNEPVHLGHGGLAHRKVFPGIDRAGAVFGQVDGGALLVAFEGLDAQFLDQRVQAGLVRGDPLAADLDGGTVHVLGPGAAADAVACLKHCDGLAGLAQFVGCGQARGTRSDDDDVAIQGCHGFHFFRFLNEWHSFTRLVPW